MKHHTKNKGDLGVAKVIADLSEKGFDILTPLITEHLPFEYKEQTFLRFQVKYRLKGDVPKKTTWNDKNGTHSTNYNINDFDYFAIYLPSVNKVCYPSIKFKGIKLTTKIPNSPTPFYWYEDFLNLTDHAVKKTYKDFNSKISRPSKPHITSEAPSKEKLIELLYSKPMNQLAKDFSVSDKTIANWAKKYNIKIPKVGYWLEKK